MTGKVEEVSEGNQDVAFGRCRDCMHFDAHTVDDETGYREAPERFPGWGSCERWHMGYADPDPIEPNGCWVENDEGWGNYVGPEFGCVLFERRRPAAKGVSETDPEVEIIVEMMNRLTDDQRLSVMYCFCRDCGCNDPYCQCSNDE
jgi:hypothetical protein